MVAPLRNLMMYHPGDATAEVWAKLTKAFVDCKVKDADEGEGHKKAYSVDKIYPKLTNPNGEPNLYWSCINGTFVILPLLQALISITTFSSSWRRA